MNKTVYFKGDLAEYTGKTEHLYKQKFYEILLLEGHLQGQTRLIKRSPNFLHEPSIGAAGRGTGA